MLKNMSAEERAAWERDHPKVLSCCFMPQAALTALWQWILV